MFFVLWFINPIYNLQLSELLYCNACLINLKNHEWTETPKEISRHPCCRCGRFQQKMGENEDRTLRNLKACRTLTDESIKAHHGRVFGSAGDSVIAEFASPVDAIVAAVEFQRNLRDRNLKITPEDFSVSRIELNSEVKNRVWNFSSDVEIKIPTYESSPKLDPNPRDREATSLRGCQWNAGNVT